MDMVGPSSGKFRKTITYTCPDCGNEVTKDLTKWYAEKIAKTGVYPLCPTCRSCALSIAKRGKPARSGSARRRKGEDPVKYLERVGTKQGNCLIWELGSLTVAGQKRVPRELVYHSYNPPPADGSYVVTTCGNENCVAAWHLTLETPQGRFWRQVERKGPEDCWEWQGYVNRDGYGECSLGLSHKVSWEWANGSSDALCVLHKCDNPPCVNPAHLFLGSAAQNTADMIAKGRGWWQAEDVRSPRVSSLDADRAAKDAELQELVAQGWSHSRIAEHFGVGSKKVAKRMSELGLDRNCA